MTTFLYTKSIKRNINKNPKRTDRQEIIDFKK